jgi:hypothetical protein
LEASGVSVEGFDGLDLGGVARIAHLRPKDHQRSQVENGSEEEQLDEAT